MSDPNLAFWFAFLAAFVVGLLVIAIWIESRTRRTCLDRIDNELDRVERRADEELARVERRAEAAHDLIRNEVSHRVLGLEESVAEGEVKFGLLAEREGLKFHWSDPIPEQIIKAVPAKLELVKMELGHKTDAPPQRKRA